MSDYLVRGIKVPRSCAVCNRDLAATVNCVYTQRLVLPDEHDMRAGRHPLCPITPLPEGHGRLIDADALRKEIDANRPGRTYEDGWALTVMDHAPTIVPAEGGGEK